MFHLFRVNAVSLVSLAAKASCGGGVFGCVGFFCLLVFWFLLGLVWFPRFAFASLHAFVPSLTGAQRTDSSPASKKTRAVSVRRLCHAKVLRCRRRPKGPKRATRPSHVSEVPRLPCKTAKVPRLPLKTTIAMCQRHGRPRGLQRAT